MSDARDTASTTTTTGAGATPRDTRAVMAILGALLLLIAVAIVVAICVNQASNSDSSNVIDGVRANRIQAVTLTTDAVYFGRLKQRGSDWVELQNAYFLRSAADPKDATKKTTTLASVKEQAGGDGNLLINVRQVLAVQNLAASAPITKSIEDATQQ
ncbi:MAG: hypothetical protein JWN41_1679 [Thermoleophilia bacterium]|nr:hypothetical protein [Thermoleophilia bacterium]